MKSLLLLLVLATPSVQGTVVDSSSAGFTVKIPLEVKAPPAEVYRKLVHNVADWWNSSHTLSGSAKNLSIDERAMGCFCEKLPDGGAVRHLEIINFAPGKKIVFSGALGPMQTMAATGTLTITFTPQEGRTKMEVTYTVSGYLSAGMDKIATPADGMLTEQFTRLKNYVEFGNPAGK